MMMKVHIVKLILIATHEVDCYSINKNIVA